MAGTDLRRWFARIFSDCLKGRHQDEAYVDWVHCVGKQGTCRMALTPVPSIGISPVHLQPCAPAITDDPDAQNPVLWNETNLLVNAAAAWQIRRVLPVEIATLDESALVKMTTPELAKRFKALPVLMVLRADNETLRQLSLELLSTESFARLTLLERRAIHNVLAERPNGWTEAQLSLYAARECELIAVADAEPGGKWVYDPLYMLQLHFAYSTYAQEPRGWHE